jgi:hypothetical protein
MARRTLVILTLVAVFAIAAGAQAQATRTWVSGVGDDVNPCSRTAPCKTFAGAISKTATGGEINVLDPGGFGAVTITKSITIDGHGPQSSILNSLVNGVIINNAAAVVTLRNLSINGAGTGLSGVRALAFTKLNIENCRIFGQKGNPGRGVDIRLTGAVTAEVNISKSSFSDNAGSNIVSQAISGTPTVKMSITDTLITSAAGAADGIFVGDNSQVMVTRTVINGMTAAAIETFGNSSVQVVDSVLNNSVRGALAANTSIIRLSQSTISNNLTAGFQISGTAIINTFGDNYFANNGPNTGALSPLLRQ